MYYNGVLHPSATAEPAWTGTIPYDGSWFAIGQQSDVNRSFNGLADEVQLFNGELSPAQIQGIYQTGGAGLCP